MSDPSTAELDALKAAVGALLRRAEAHDGRIDEALRKLDDLLRATRAAREIDVQQLSRVYARRAGFATKITPQLSAMTKRVANLEKRLLASGSGR